MIILKTSFRNGNFTWFCDLRRKDESFIAVLENIFSAYIIQRLTSRIFYQTLSQFILTM